MIDGHTHVLPGIDDGSKDIVESLEILRQMREEGIQTVVATPHFYPDDDVERFLKRREAAYALLQEGMRESKEEWPEIRKGAEVLLSVDTPELPGLEQLCIEGTHYILIEMPYMDWSEWVYQAIYKLIVQRQLRPIIAHVERYASVVSDIDKLNRLAQMDVLMQMNTYSLVHKHKRLALQLIKHNMIHLLGSDVHRSPSHIPVKVGYDVVEKNISKRVASSFTTYGEVILADERMTKKEIKPLRKKFGLYF